MSRRPRVRLDDDAVVDVDEVVVVAVGDLDFDASVVETTDES